MAIKKTAAPAASLTFDKELFKRSVLYNIKTLYRKTLEEASAQQVFQAVAYAIKDAVVDNWMNTQREYEKLLSNSREGIPLNKAEFYEAEKIISKGLKSGQHLYQVLKANHLDISLHRLQVCKERLLQCHCHGPPSSRQIQAS